MSAFNYYEPIDQKIQKSSTFLATTELEKESCKRYQVFRPFNLRSCKNKKVRDLLF
jgi:hypothetical protein